MTIIEQFQKAKSDSREIEDGIVATDSFAAVIDGSTSKGNFEFEGKTSGQIAMEIVSNAITTLPDTADIDEITNILTLALHNFYEEHQLLPMVSSHPENRPTCSIAIYSRFHHEVWLIGDTQCRIKGKTFDNPNSLTKYYQRFGRTSWNISSRKDTARIRSCRRIWDANTSCPSCANNVTFRIVRSIIPFRML